MNKAKTRNLPIVECKRCRKRKRTMLLGKMICQTCYLKEQKANCGACGKEKRFVAEGGGICPECVKRASLPTEIECAGCGKSKQPAKRGGEYCKPCQTRVKCGRGRCSGCGKDRRYIHKTKRLCNVCCLNHWAPNRLRTYIKTGRISNEYNLALFRQLVGLINWEMITEEDRGRFYDFGEFLQCHTFEETLEWGSILKLKSELPPAKFRSVRFCLERLGELLLDPVKDYNWEECTNGINPLVPLASLDLDAIAVFKKYDLWLRTERKNTPKARRNHFETLGGFWRWCSIYSSTTLFSCGNFKVCESLRSVGRQRSARNRLNHWQILSSSNFGRGNFRETSSLWVGAASCFGWNQQTNRGCEIWLSDLYESVIRNYEIQITHTFSSGPGGAFAGDL